MSTLQLPSSSGAQKCVIRVIRDDLLHPIAGSKLRKFDALWPQLLADGITDIVSRQYTLLFTALVSPPGPALKDVSNIEGILT